MAPGVETLNFEFFSAQFSVNVARRRAGVARGVHAARNAPEGVEGADSPRAPASDAGSESAKTRTLLLDARSKCIRPFEDSGAASESRQTAQSATGPIKTDQNRPRGWRSQCPHSFNPLSDIPRMTRLLNIENTTMIGRCRAPSVAQTRAPRHRAALTTLARYAAMTMYISA
jgi:hypothetical protein